MRYTTLPLDVRANLTVLYGEPQRHYHNLSHVQHCIREYETLEDSQKLDGMPSFCLEAMELAIWFHDCVYDPKRPHGLNELESAKICRQTTNSFVSFEAKMFASEIIEQTISHMQPLDVLDPQQKACMEYFLDIDLSIFGSTTDYKTYAENIRKEYNFVPKDIYVNKRTEILKMFLSSPKIFRSEYFHNKYEVTARRNIQWEIDNLSSLV